ncbi:MAG: hypothetical protein FJ100_13275 [Deltaproteobacteria bacterium]|nr:hypothetical protein [Deltaproteobacteria bacterium]
MTYGSVRSVLWALAIGMVALGGGIAPTPARAMTVLQVDLKALVATADVVLYGKVAGTRVLDRRKEGRGTWTEIALDVAEVWKGDSRLAGKRFAWMHVGGTTADGITVHVPGMPTFAAGEETVVVLEKTSDSHVVSGGPQGKFSVKALASGHKTVTRELPDVHFVRRDPQTGAMQPAPKPVAIVRTLNEFRTEVAGYVADAAKAAAIPAKAPATKNGSVNK